MLHGLERADRLVELLAFLRVLDRELERALRGADAVDDVPRPRAGRASARPQRRPASPCRSGARRAPSKRDAALLARTVDRRRRRRPRTSSVANTPSSPSSSSAVTSTTSAAAASATCTLAPSSRQPLPSRVGARRRRAASRSGRRPRRSRPCRSSNRRPDAGSSASSASEHRADRRRRVRRRAHRAAELFEHDRGVDHAHARAAVRLADEQPDHTELDQAVPHRRVGGGRRRTRRAPTPSAPCRRGTRAPTRAAFPVRLRIRSPRGPRDFLTLTSGNYPAPRCACVTHPRTRPSAPSSTRGSTSTSRRTIASTNRSSRARTCRSGRATGSAHCSTRAGSFPAGRPSSAAATPRRRSR